MSMKVSVRKAESELVSPPHEYCRIDIEQDDVSITVGYRFNGTTNKLKYRYANGIKVPYGSIQEMKDTFKGIVRDSQITLTPFLDIVFDEFDNRSQEIEYHYHRLVNADKHKDIIDL